MNFYSYSEIVDHIDTLEGDIMDVKNMIRQSQAELNDLESDLEHWEFELENYREEDDE